MTNNLRWFVLSVVLAGTLLVLAACQGSGAAKGLQAIAAGSKHTCVITEAGGVKCWGWNHRGQLGDGTQKDSYSPVDVTGLTSGVKAISIGTDHSCALTTAGGVKCWGSNSNGQLGDGHGSLITNSFVPVDVEGLTSGVQVIAAGNGYTCALTAAGGVKCWGYNRYGRLGDGTTDDRLTPVDVMGLTSGVQALSTSISGYPCAVTTQGGAKCWGALEYSKLDGGGLPADSPAPKDVDGLTGDVKSLSTGLDHACAMTTAGGVKCWGENEFGELGDGAPAGSRTPVDASGLTGGVQAIAAGLRFTCALMSADEIRCWGDNLRGQVGDGTTTDRATPVLVSGLGAVKSIVAGGTHACVLTAAGGAKCWGNNENGQLGNGTNTSSATPVDVPGL